MTRALPGRKALCACGDEEFGPSHIGDVTTVQIRDLTVVERARCSAVAVPEYLNGQDAVGDSGEINEVIAVVITSDGSVVLRRSDLQVLLAEHAQFRAEKLTVEDLDSMRPEPMGQARDRVLWYKDNFGPDTMAP